VPRRTQRLGSQLSFL